MRHRFMGMFIIYFKNITNSSRNFDSYFEMPNAFDISPVTYLDSIMNGMLNTVMAFQRLTFTVPMFDFTQEGSFL